MDRYLAPRLLEGVDGVNSFWCRSEEQTLWLRQHGRQANAAGTSRVRVVTQPASREVVAYYAWCVANIRIEDAPKRLGGAAGRYPQPVALLTRLGESIDHENRGLGAGLLQDVITRTAELGIEIGCRGLLVHTESDEALSFYLHLIPEFEPSPTDDLHLILLMKDILRTLRG